MKPNYNAFLDLDVLLKILCKSESLLEDQEKPRQVHFKIFKANLLVKCFLFRRTNVPILIFKYRSMMLRKSKMKGDQSRIASLYYLDHTEIKS